MDIDDRGEANLQDVHPMRFVAGERSKGRTPFEINSGIEEVRNLYNPRPWKEDRLNPLALLRP